MKKSKFLIGLVSLVTMGTMNVWAESLQVQISKSTEDAEERIGTGKVYLKSSDLELGEEKGKGAQLVGLRFRHVNLPKGAQITNTYVQFTVDEKSTQQTSLTIWGEKTRGSHSFVDSRSSISNRAITLESVDWYPNPWRSIGEHGANQRTPDLSSIIQEIIDQSGWNKTIGLRITGTGSRVAESYDGSANQAPVLHIEYSKGGGNSVGDLVWNDANRDGLQNNNESGINGLRVSLLDRNKEVIDTTYTANGGKYLFSGLDDGKYYVKVDLENGRYKTTKKKVRGDSDDAQDSNAHGNGRTFSFELKKNRYNSTIDIGLYRDTEEVDLEISALDSSNIVQHSATIYWNTNVKTTAQVEYGQSTAYGLWTMKDSRLIDNHALVLNNLQACSTYHYRVISQDQNGNSVTSNDNTFKTICVEIKNSVGDLVWNDANRDGLQNNNESGINGLRVSLLDRNKEVIDTTYTANGGKYLFSGLDDGKYYVKVDLENGRYKTTKKKVRGDSDDAQDSNAHGNGRTFSFELKKNRYNSTIDIGLYGGTIADNIKPVITLLGNAKVSVLQGENYEDAGATAQDNIDGDITNDIEVNNLVDTTTVGTYSVTYNVSDAAGNVAQRVSRVVNVKSDIYEEKNTRVCEGLSVENARPCTISTFHNISVYLSEDLGSKERNAMLSYRLEGENQWHKAQTLIYSHIKSPISYSKHDSEDTERGDFITVKKGDVVSKADYRGSIVNLLPGQIYDIRLEFNGKTYNLKATTWNEQFSTKPIDIDKYPVRSDKQYTIEDVHGTKEKYILIDGEVLAGKDNKYKINGETKFNILVKNSSYIILRHFNLTNAVQDAIRITGENSHHIVIEHCDISKWGSEDKTNKKGHRYALDSQAAIRSSSGVYSSVFQYNKIHDPMYTANSWGEYNEANKYDPKHPIEKYHPRGAIGISLSYCKIGNNVIRYNEFFSKKTPFMDIFGAGKNNSAYGSPGADSDIYGNYFSNAVDDAIEAEGGGQNVRIWSNYIEKTYIAIANASVAVGPIYIWKNISGKPRRITEFYTKEGYEVEYKTYSGRKLYSSFLKMGAARPRSTMQGMIYVYNNTIINKDNEAYGGLGTALYQHDNESSNRTMKHITTRNNILDVPANVNPISIDGKESEPSTENYSHDMVASDKSLPGHYYGGGIKGSPEYKGDTKLNSSRVGSFGLKADSIGTGEGKCIENIIPINHPDVGAQQQGKNSMTFGVKAEFNPPSIEACN